MKCQTTTAHQFHTFFAIVLWSVGMLLLSPGGAAARTETLRWSHADEQNAENVVRFEVRFGDVQGNYTETQNLGLPTPNQQGVYESSFEVEDTRSVYVVIHAIGSSLPSDPSNFQLRAGLEPPAPEPPPAPTPPPPAPEPAPTPPAPTPAPTPVDDPGVSTPNAEATLRIDFSEGGGFNWIDTGAANSLAENASLFFVANAGGDPALTTQSTLTNIHSHYAGSEPEFSNIQLAGRMAITDSDAGIGVTLYSQYPSSDTYYRLKRDPGQEFGVSAHPHPGPNLVCDSASTGVSPEVGKWYDYEISVEDEGSRNRVSASVWERGTPKPASPQVVCTDASGSRPTSGKIGVWSMGSGQKFWDDMEVSPLQGAVPEEPPVPAPLPPPPLPPVLLDIVPLNEDA